MGPLQRSSTSIVPRGTDSVAGAALSIGRGVLPVCFQRLISATFAIVATPLDSIRATISAMRPAFGAAWASSDSAMWFAANPRMNTATISAWWRIARWLPVSCIVNRRLAAVLSTVVASCATMLAVPAAIVARSTAYRPR